MEKERKREGEKKRNREGDRDRTNGNEGEQKEICHLFNPFGYGRISRPISYLEGRCTP